MRRSGILLFVLLLGSALAHGNPLWQNAVELFDRYGGLVPGRMTVRAVQYNGRGNVVSLEESELEFFLRPDGEVDANVIYALSDGEDVTEERRENPGGGPGAFPGAEGSQDDNAFSGLQRSPFDPAEQENIQITRIGPPVEMGGTTARIFEFVQTTGEDSRTVGTAWLNEESGEPLALELMVEPLPRIVTEFAMRQEFARDEEGRWIVRRIEFDGEGTLLFLRRRIETELVFSQYFPSP